MATINYTAPDGSKHQIPLADGEDASAAVASFEQSNGFAKAAPVPIAEAALQGPRTLDADPVDTLPDLPSVGDTIEPRREKGILESVGDRLGVVGDFAKGTLRDITGANVDTADASTGEQVQRGVGLGTRTVAQTIPNLAAGLTDIGAGILNVPAHIISKGDELLGGKPLPESAFLPTDSARNMNALFDEIFPQPESFGERVVHEGGQLMLTGGAGGAALAPKLGAVQRTGSQTGVVRGLGDDIGNFFATSPKTFAAVEAGGGAGATVAGELADEADASPAQGLAARVAGGVAGGLTPQGLMNLARRSATGLRNFADDALFGERRAATEIQKLAGGREPAAEAAARIDAAPEGVLPGRASGNRNLQQLEEAALADPVALNAIKDPTERAAAIARANTAADDLAAAEERIVREATESLGPGATQGDFERTVLQTVSPDGTDLRPGDTQNLVRQVAAAFRGAYDNVKGFNVQNRVVDPDTGTLVPLRTEIDRAIDGTGVITTPAIRQRVRDRIESRIEQIETSGNRIGGPDDAPIHEIASDELLSLRSALRDKQRQLDRAGINNPDAAEEAEVLNGVISVLTRVMDSGLPRAQAELLRATDAQYAQFATATNAVNRSGTKGLTPETLATAQNRTVSAGQQARGETGELGRLAETGRDPSRVLGKPEEAARLVRNATPEETARIHSDLSTAITGKATPKAGPNAGRLNGRNWTQQIEQNRETMIAAGMSEQQISNMQRLARELTLVQGKSPAALQKLVDDNLNFLLRGVAAIAGSKSGSSVLNFFGGAGAGGSLIVTRLGSERFNVLLRGLSVDNADTLMRQAALDEDLMKALLTKVDAGPREQAQAVRTIQAWITQLGDAQNDANEAE